MSVRYTEVGRKTVEDSDGFLTDYTWYYDEVEEKHLFIFGDREIYNPEEDSPDYECDRWKEAYNWFNCYE